MNAHLGGGLGFADALLLNVPVKVTMVEKNAVNGGGVVYRVCPRCTTRRHVDVNIQERMEGVSVRRQRDRRLCSSTPMSTFPVIINASGCTNQLSCPGAERHRCLRDLQSLQPDLSTSQVARGRRTQHGH